MPNYDNTFYSPPVPAALVKLHDPKTGVTLTNVLMILDTGADATFVPRFVVEALGISTVSDKFYEVTGYDGTVSASPVVRLEILIDGRIFRGQYLIVDQTHGFIGRDILNLIRLELDGPSQVWTILPRKY